MFIMSRIRIPARLKGQFIRRGHYAVFTQSDITAKKIAAKVDAMNLVRSYGCGKINIGACAYYWSFFGCVHDPDLYA
jgi:hypothetical protein